MADEIIEQRTYNQKVFESNNSNEKIYEIHAGHIHYKDGVELKDIDLSIREDSGKWIMDKASYSIDIPEFCDAEFIFLNKFEDANQVIKSKPVCNHVEGQKIGNSILYQNAFGNGIDLRATPRRQGFLKEIIINQKPAQIKDMSFDFELTLPINVRILDSKGIEKNQELDIDFEDRALKIESNGKSSFFTKSFVWDSADNREPVKIKISKRNGKLFLTKTVTSAFLDKAVYPVYTDHPTDYYAGSGDGYILYDENTLGWDVVHDASAGESAVSTAIIGGVTRGSSIQALYRRILRGFIPIDTSGIADTDTISAASLFMWPETKASQFTTDQTYLNIVLATAPTDATTALVTGDYDLCGDVNNPAEGSTDKQVGDFNTGSYNEWILNATGITFISKTGVTRFGIRSGHDIEDVDPGQDAGSNDDSYIIFSESETAGTGQDPYVAVTAAAAGGLIMNDFIGNDFIAN